MWEITIPKPSAGDPSPLWILDGQHRINGLAKSSQAENPIPVVLLVNGSGQSVYSGRDFTRIFAEVTVTAQGLDPIHQEWLSYAYQLKDYADDAPAAELQQAAFETVAYLCGNGDFDRIQPNPWMNGIRFNPEPESKDGSPLLGFQYSSVELKDVLLHWYFEICTGTLRTAPVRATS